MISRSTGNRPIPRISHDELTGDYEQRHGAFRNNLFWFLHLFLVFGRSRNKKKRKRSRKVSSSRGARSSSTSLIFTEVKVQREALAGRTSFAITMPTFRGDLVSRVKRAHSGRYTQVLHTFATMTQGDTRISSPLFHDETRRGMMSFSPFFFFFSPTLPLSFPFLESLEAW